MDILYEFPIAASVARVFDGVSTPAGLDTWWTVTSAGEPRLGAGYDLGFGPEYQWKARITAVDPPRLIEWTITKADPDWLDTVVRIELEAEADGTLIRFAHRGWREANRHYRVSNFCWAMYLRLLRLNLETGLVVEYGRRLAV